MAAIRLCDIVHNRSVYRQTSAFLGEVQALLGDASVKGFETDFSFRYSLVAAMAHHSVLENLKGVDEILHWRVVSFLSVIESYLADRPFDSNVSVRPTHLPNSSIKDDGVRVFLSGRDSPYRRDFHAPTKLLPQ
ncbi:hypothetical protein, partial [Stutzerimonas kunmingensis]|uniref:hypothetical protein n=1 Tax=Stutzerimonas kunmingensis TaxID=1211807 RepID=UPI001C612172